MSTGTLTRPRNAPIESSATTRRRGRRRDLLILLGLLLIVGLVIGWNITRFPAMQDDEGTYTAQAWAVQHGALAHYQYWYDHPPLGWVQIAALSWLPQALHLGGDQAIASTRFLMLLLALINVPLIYGIARRLHLARPFAAAAVLLWALSPLTVFEARQVYLDNVALSWVLLAVYLMLSPRRLLWHCAAGAAAMAVAVLSKETTALLVPMVCYIMWQRVVPPLRGFAVALSATGFTGLLLVYPLFAVLRSELLPGAGHVSLFDALAFQFATRPSGGPLLDPDSEKRYTLGVWLDYDVWLVILGLLAAVLLLRRREMRPLALGLALGLVPVLKPGYLPGMFVIVYLPLMALLVAALADSLWTWAGGFHDRPRGIARTAVLALCATSLGVVAPAWAAGDKQQMTADATHTQRQVVAWLSHNVPHDESVLADDAYWLDLVQLGFSGDGWNGPIWHYKIDLDPIPAGKNLPNGWEDVDYVVYNDAIKGHVKHTTSPLMEAAVEHGRVVASFGDENAVQILQVMNGRNNPPARSPGNPPHAQAGTGTDIGDSGSPARPAFAPTPRLPLGSVVGPLPGRMNTGDPMWSSVAAALNGLRGTQRGACQAGRVPRCGHEGPPGHEESPGRAPYWR